MAKGNSQNRKQWESWNIKKKEKQKEVWTDSTPLSFPPEFSKLSLTTEAKIVFDVVLNVYRENVSNYKWEAVEI